jgi:histidinol-phosphate phosphatase family protein
MTGVTQAVILCGGMGTRLKPYTDTLPKPMIPVNGRPFLEYLIEQLRDQGIAHVVLLTGYRAQQIEDHFADGTRFGVHLTYSRGPAEWETARRLWEAREKLDVGFLLLYCDNYVPFRLTTLLKFHRDKHRMLSLLLSEKGKGNIEVGSDGLVRRYDSSRSSPGLGYVEIGYMIVERDAVLSLIDNPDVSLSHVIRELVSRNQLAGLVVGDRYHSISDPERWKLAEQYLRCKRVVLIDRDGTLNFRPPRGQYLTSWHDFRWLPGALEGLHALGRGGFSFALISNQAGIARGLLTKRQVDAINNQIAQIAATCNLAMLGAYVCPHYWEDGCACRKPAPGLFFQASRELLLRLDRTLYICDDPRDCQAAFRAGCESVFVGNLPELANLPTEEQPAYTAPTIADCVPWIRARFDAWSCGPRPPTDFVSPGATPYTGHQA